MQEITSIYAQIRIRNLASSPFDDDDYDPRCSCYSSCYYDGEITFAVILKMVKHAYIDNLCNDHRSCNRHEHHHERENLFFPLVHDGQWLWEWACLLALYDWHDFLQFAVAS